MVRPRIHQKGGQRGRRLVDPCEAAVVVNVVQGHSLRLRPDPPAERSAQAPCDQIERPSLGRAGDRETRPNLLKHPIFESIQGFRQFELHVSGFRAQSFPLVSYHPTCSVWLFCLQWQ